MSMDLDQIGRNEPATVDPADTPGGWLGEVKAAPVDGIVRVVVPGFSSDIGEPCRYVAPAGEPVAGDECLVVFVDSDLPWALFPGTAAGGGLGGTPQTYTATNVTTDRAFDANATTLDELADVLGTLIADLRSRGVVA